MRVYLTVFTVGACVFVVGAGLVSYFGLRYGKVDFSFSELYQYQRQKMGSARSVDTVFVGDSSLGNAIDARLWSELAGETTLNLALTGAYGYAGSLNMVRQTLRLHRPRAVVVMQGADSMLRPISHLGYISTAETGIPLGDVPPWELVKAFLNADMLMSVFRQLFKDLAGLRPNRIDNDYVRQGARPADIDRIRAALGSRYSAASLNPRKTFYLRRIADICVAEGLNCVYAHGPVLEVYCKTSKDYFLMVNALIRDAGLAVAEGTPMCVPAAELGDANDHIRQEFKHRYTRRYFEVLAPYLYPCNVIVTCPQPSLLELHHPRRGL